MAYITFYTKPGCATSTKQIALLRQSGHEVQELDLLSTPWHAEELKAYFGSMPVKQWFNPNAPRIKSGEIIPSAYDSATAMKLLLEDHLLIRRPLMKSEDRLLCGFEPATVHEWVGLSCPEDAISRSSDLQSCSQPGSDGLAGRCP